MRDLFFCHEGTKHSDRLEMSFFVFLGKHYSQQYPQTKKNKDASNCHLSVLEFGKTCHLSVLRRKITILAT